MTAHREGLSCAIAAHQPGSKEVAISQIGRQIAPQMHQKPANKSWRVAACRGVAEFMWGRGRGARRNLIDKTTNRVFIIRILHNYAYVTDIMQFPTTFVSNRPYLDQAIKLFCVSYGCTYLH